MKKLDSKNSEVLDKNAKSGEFLVSLMVAVLVIGISAVAYMRSNSEKIFPSSRPEVNKSQADRFCKALEEGKEKEAILSASLIIPDDSPELPNPDFIHLFSDNGLGTMILTSGFSHFDYLRWKDAWEIKKIVDSYNQKDDPLNAFFIEVAARKNLLPEKTKNPSTSVIGIWNKPNASFYELTRLFSSFAYQSGYDVQIVFIYDELRNPLHTLCELRKDGKSYVADIVNVKLFKDVNVGGISSNPEIVKGIWPEKVIGSIDRRVYWLPAEAMDYKLYNMQLNSKLKALGVENLPRFGEDPQYRIDGYIQKYLKNSKNRRFSYWNFPIKSLMSSPSFPDNWKLPPAKPEEKSESGN